MTFFIILTLLMIIVALLIFIKKRGEYEAAILARKIEISEQLKRTMAMGLAYRFNFPTVKTEDGKVKFEKGSNLFLKQNPLEFEDFVADVMKKRFGGTTFVTSQSGDFGVDFEQSRENGLYLGQVKVYKHDLGYEPIAILHSKMIKQEAKGGYVVTTGDFTDAAKDYAKGINIEIINGVQLVDYWLEKMDSTVYSFNNEFT